MFGFRPEPIAIPVVATNPSLDIPIPSAIGSTCSFDPAASSSGPSTAPTTASSLEPLESLWHSDIQYNDLHILHNVGHGSSGVVQKVLHLPSDSVLALKTIPVEADEVKRKQILLELKTLHESMHPSIVSYYGAFYREGAVHVALEYMDASLLDISRARGVAIPEPILAAIATPVLHGLAYIHREKHVIHRDIKPSNLLVDGSGNVKIADFGVSGELGHTLAKCASWVGTVHYMSPERIQGSSYSYDSDVWSLGITLLELATAAFPYPAERSGRRVSFWDLLDAIVETPPPMPPAHFSAPFHAFIGGCLQKAPTERASSSQLLSHSWLGAHGAVEMAEWLRAALASLPPRGSENEGAGGAGGNAGWLERELEGGTACGCGMSLSMTMGATAQMGGVMPPGMPHAHGSLSGSDGRGGGGPPPTDLDATMRDV